MFNRIFKIINSRIFVVSMLILFVFLFLRQCGETREARNESNINLNNYIASQDSIRFIKTKSDGMLVEIAGMDKTNKELESENKGLYVSLGFEKNKKPSTVIETRYVYRDTNIIVGSENAFSNIDSTGTLSFRYNPKFEGKNSLDIRGSIPYRLGDSGNSVNFGDYKLDIEQSVDIKTGLYRDPKTNALYVRLYTEYPNITIKELNAINVIDDPATKKAIRMARKPFAIGLNVGYGMSFSNGGYQNGPYVGIGLSYSPRIFQFGK